MSTRADSIIISWRHALCRIKAHVGWVCTQGIPPRRQHTLHTEKPSAHTPCLRADTRPPVTQTPASSSHVEVNNKGQAHHFQQFDITYQTPDLIKTRVSLHKADKVNVHK